MIIRWIACVLVAFLWAAPLAAETPKSGIEKFGTTPLVFEPNHGQADSSVRFLSRGDRYGLFLTETEAIVSLSGATPALIRMQLEGQNPHPRIYGSGTQSGASHYFKGTDASKWQGSVPHFLKVDYQEVYPGIDLTYYGNQRQLEYDFTVRPHASPDTIKLKFSGVDRIEIGVEGDLILHTVAGDFRHERPRVFQHRNGVEESVEGQFVLLGSGRVGFKIGKYDSDLPLVIDPKFVYSTYFGGIGANGDIGYDLKVDALGTTYVTGYTSSMDFFNTNLSTTAPGGGNLDGFVMKVDPSGTTVLSAVYFGGSADDEGHRIALDNAGSVYVTGYTSSIDFPIVNGFQTTLRGRKDAYVMKVDNAVTQILFSSYIGGNRDDLPLGLSVDANYNVYVVGETISTDFPLAAPIRNRLDPDTATDAFITKISPAGSIIYSTYLGGRGADRAYDVASDADGNAYVAGYTTAAIPNVLNAIYGGPNDPRQAFIGKLSPDGGTILLFAYIGGVGSDEAVRVVLDSAQNIIVSGYTNSPNFPTANAIQPFIGGEFDIFLIKLLPDFSDVVFSTYIGADGSESAPGLAVESNGNIHLAGFTSSFQFPVVNGIDIGTSGGNLHGDRDAYVMKLSPTGRILFSTYVGARSSDGAVAIAVDPVGDSYVTGFTLSTDFPTVNAFQPELAQNPFFSVSDGILMKITSKDVLLETPVVVPNNGGYELTTIGNSNSVQFVHATFDVTATGVRPAGMAILDLRQGGGEVGEVAFPLLPFILNGRVYINENFIQSTNISLVNPSADPVDMSFFITDRTGAQSNFGSITIPPFSGFAQPVMSFPFRVPINSSGSLTFSTTAPVAAMAFRTFSGSNNAILLTYLPITDPYVQATGITTIPQLSQDPNWASEFLLLNNSEAQATGVVRFYSNAPNETDPTQPAVPVEVQLDRGTVTEVAYNIAPLATDSFAMLLSDTKVNGYAQIVPDAGTITPGATAIMTHLKTGVSTLFATLEAQVPVSDLRLYVEYSGDFERQISGTIVTPITITNPSNSPTDVTLTLVNMNGTPTGLSTTFNLVARGHISTYVHRLAGFAAIPNPFQGILLVHATGPGVVAFGMRERISESDNLVGTTTGPIKENAGGGNKVIFPHILDGGGYATRFILLSEPSGSGTSGVLQFADEDGEPLPLSVEPGGVSALWPAALPPALSVPNFVEDLNADGKADIIWRDLFGNYFGTLMNGATIINERFISNIWGGWSIVGGGDFNGDGKSDLLWHDVSGNVALWMMDGLRVDSFGSVGNLGTEWSVAGTGDFNADGKTDILWHSESGDVSIWLMDGMTVTGTGNAGNVWTSWSIAGVGDFNGDGKADILWRDSDTGDAAIWLMDGAAVLSFSTIGNMPESVAVAGVGDFDGNGKADVLWRGTLGAVTVWFMDGTSIVSSNLVDTAPTGWTIAGDGDFDGDGKDDILWRDNRGIEVIWFLNGATVTAVQKIGI
jgi:hypothetical protein